MILSDANLALMEHIFIGLHYLYKWNSFSLLPNTHLGYTIFLLVFHAK